MLGRPKIMRPGGHHDLAGSVVEGVGGHALDDGQVVDDPGQVGQQLGQLGPRLAVPGELELRAQQLGIRIDERRAVALEQLGRGQLAVEPGELGLVVEELQVARAAGHEQEDHPLGLGGEMGRPGRQRVDALGRGRRRRSRVARLAEQLAQGHRSQADAALLQEPAARDEPGIRRGDTGDPGSS